MIYSSKYPEYVYHLAIRIYFMYVLLFTWIAYEDNKNMVKLMLINTFMHITLFTSNQL